jgi:hypothetical protein
MKNNFVATFMLLAAGLVFNDVASVEGKPAKRNLREWPAWEVVRVHNDGTGAIFKCHGTFNNYKNPRACYSAALIKGALVDMCAAADPIACKLLSGMKQAEMTAYQVEGAETVRRMSEN